jgi:hypothetical protein
MTWSEKWQKAKDAARGLKEDYQTVRRAKASGELKQEIAWAEKAERKGELSTKEKILLQGLKIIQGKPKRKTQKRIKRHSRTAKRRL